MHKALATRLLLFALAVFGSGCAESARGFDYYLMSLSWSPQYCASEARPGDPQCARPYGFVLHGLWPQNERGWPKDCGPAAYLDNRLIAQMLPIMPSKALVIHEWRQHGVCSGLAAGDYFALARQAYNGLQVPAQYQSTTTVLSRDLATLKRDFLAANPALSADGVAVQCSGRYLKEIRICLSRELTPRACGSDVQDRCRGDFVLRSSR